MPDFDWLINRPNLCGFGRAFGGIGFGGFEAFVPLALALALALAAKAAEAAGLMPVIG